MTEQTILDHHIKKHIVNVLIHSQYARFRDMRPPLVDTNLYSYHLSVLKKDGFVVKTSKGYTLGLRGILFADRISIASLAVRTQPKIVTMHVIKNADNKFLLFRRKRHPFIETWSLPHGKVHVDDESLMLAAKRELTEKLGLNGHSPLHVGDCYIRIADDRGLVMSTLGHIFYLTIPGLPANDNLRWVSFDELSAFRLAPAVEDIISRVLARGEYFFEEYTKVFPVSQDN